MNSNSTLQQVVVLQKFPLFNDFYIIRFMQLHDIISVFSSYFDIQLLFVGKTIYLSIPLTVVLRTIAHNWLASFN